MKTRLPWVLAAVSLCFNVFFVFGYAQARSTPKRKTPEDRCRAICARLGLDDRQCTRYIELDALRRSRLAELRKPYAREYDEYWSEVLKGKPDRARLEEIQNKGALLRSRSRAVRTDFLIEALSLMTPKQKAHYARILRGRRKSRK